MVLFIVAFQLTSFFCSLTVENMKQRSGEDFQVWQLFLVTITTVENQGATADQVWENLSVVASV